MAKRQDNPSRPQGQPAPSRRLDLDPLGLATLAGVVVLLMIAFANMRHIDRIDRTLGERLAKLEGQIAQIAARQATQPAQPQGPDPNRVYAISIAKAPIRGAAGAPIVIAEFSDFQ